MNLMRHGDLEYKTKDININDILTGEDRYWIARVIDARVKEEYGDMYPFKWEFQASGHFVC